MVDLFLVTGATGFVGSHLVEMLRARGERVRILARDAGKVPEEWRKDVEIVEGDVTDPPSLAPAVKDVDIVLHVAGVINLPPGEGERFYRVNTEGTKHLFHAARTSGRPLKRFLYCSSVGVMGKLKRIPADEETPCAPTNAYEASKLAAERWVLAEGKRRGVPVSVTRPAWVYGPGDRRTFPIFFLIARKRFIMVGKGDTWIHPVFVRDLVKGILQCARSEKAIGRKMILAGQQPVRLKDLVALISHQCDVRLLPVKLPVAVATVIALGLEILYKPLHKQPLLHRRRLGFFLRDQGFDISLARRCCGYVPGTSLEEGIRETVTWYKRNGWI